MGLRVKRTHRQPDCWGFFYSAVASFQKNGVWGVSGGLRPPETPHPPHLSERIRRLLIKEVSLSSII
jgi:hypothetical protein